jgi:hypothetical protein
MIKIKYIAVLIGILAFSPDIQAQNAPYFKGGNLHILNSSHQDIAYMDAPEVCIRFRDEQLITPVLIPSFCVVMILKEMIRRLHLISLMIFRLSAIPIL